MEKGAVVKLKNSRYKAIILKLSHCQVKTMNKYNPDPTAKKVKYIASVIYLLVLAFIVGGSYIYQHQKATESKNVEEGVIWPEAN